jgi:hypothetical protein
MTLIYSFNDEFGVLNGGGFQASGVADRGVHTVRG